MEPLLSSSIKLPIKNPNIAPGNLKKEYPRKAASHLIIWNEFLEQQRYKCL